MAKSDEFYSLRLVDDGYFWIAFAAPKCTQARTMRLFDKQMHRALDKFSFSVVFPQC